MRAHVAWLRARIGIDGDDQGRLRTHVLLRINKIYIYS
jgi:hypothetical protein